MNQRTRDSQAHWPTAELCPSRLEKRRKFHVNSPGTSHALSMHITLVFFPNSSASSPIIPSPSPSALAVSILASDGAFLDAGEEDRRRGDRVLDIHVAE